MTIAYCVKCGRPFEYGGVLAGPVFCHSCRADLVSLRTGPRRLPQCFDGHDIPAETPADQHLRQTGAPRLPGWE